MNRQDIDTALEILNSLVRYVNAAIDAGDFVPSSGMLSCLMTYDALLDECVSVPYLLPEEDLRWCEDCQEYHHAGETCEIWGDYEDEDDDEVSDYEL